MVLILLLSSLLPSLWLPSSPRQEMRQLLGSRDGPALGASWKPRGRAVWTTCVTCPSLHQPADVVLAGSAGRWRLPVEARDESRGRAFPTIREVLV